MPSIRSAIQDLGENLLPEASRVFRKPAVASRASSRGRFT